MNRREFRRFLLIARGSSCELQTQLELARALNLGSPTVLETADALAEQTSKMLYSLIDSMKLQSG